ncbi:MAG: 23S rRNA (adenine(2503)-C(2))-methyltransferase RlmN [Gammaproteobacteria bacterium]|nr:MAG: 23S rRNA (adenine(2503)-C(2))-methyltransferase RlmN [Gammaproteobacteria bacterium]
MALSAVSASNLLGLSRQALEAHFAMWGEKPFRARQFMQWVYQRGVLDFAEMTDMSRALRARLAAECTLTLPDIDSEQRSGDGTIKWLLNMGASQGIEMVYIPEPERTTLCISSQVGCALDCAFCATAQQGFNRNLSAAEIVGQVLLANHILHAEGRQISNVVFMGMGEPLANYRAVVPATRVLIDDLGFGLSRRRVTISTSGLVPQIDRLGEDCNVALAVSLHAPNDALRDELVPINRIHPIEALLDACWRYAERQSSRQITFEYVMLDGVNDSLAHADMLVGLLRGRPAKVNLIPFNPFPETRFQRSPARVIDAFRDRLNQRGVRTTTRRTRGDDIDAACGQLAGRVADRTRVRLSEKTIRAAGL